MNLKQILALKEGDIIPIQMPKQVVAKVEDVAMFRSGFGEHKTKAALKIEEFIEHPKDTSTLAIIQSKGKENE
jgi:flagellar motor switch protein FliM